MNVNNPFPGLRAFGEEESHLFFGRERPTDELLRKLRSNRFIAVVGTSGSGKSSLVRAGMLPDLYGGLMTSAGSSWRVALFRPGNSPIKALAEALSKPLVFGSSETDAALKTAITETVLRRGANGLVTVTQQARMSPQENLLVVIDQFEELFRFKNTLANAGAADEAAAFVKLIIEASAQTHVPIYIVLTMRSEFLGDCTQFRDLPEAINSSQYLIPRMTRDQQKAAVNGPVAVGGASLTPRLLQRLLNDVGDNPDQLPILQHAMMRTWDNWQQQGLPDEPVDIAHYEAIGTMKEALCIHADEAFNELKDPAQRRLAERIFKRLTEKGVDNRELRFPALVGDLCSITGAGRDQVINVIEVFRREGRWFLMPPPDIELKETTLIDISHESLIRIWRKLQRWVNEEAESASIYRRLSETSTLFSRNEAGLWRDPDLHIALRWRARNDPNKTWAERYSSNFDGAIDFLDKSKVAERRRKLLIMAPVVLLPLLGVVWGAMHLDAKAKAQASKAELAEQGAKEAQQQANAAADQKEVATKREAVLVTALQAVTNKDRGEDVSELSEKLEQQVQQLVAFDSLAVPDLVKREETVVTGSSAEPERIGEAIKIPVDAEQEASKAGASGQDLVSDSELVASLDDVELEPAESTALASTTDFQICKDVVALEPLGCDSSEFAPGKVWVFARVKSEIGQDLTLEWYNNDRKVLRSRQLKIGPNNSTGYRTYDWKTMSESGEYEARLFDSEKNLLNSQTFKIMVK